MSDLVICSCSYTREAAAWCCGIYLAHPTTGDPVVPGLLFCDQGWLYQEAPRRFWIRPLSRPPGQLARITTGELQVMLKRIEFLFGIDAQPFKRGERVEVWENHPLLGGVIGVVEKIKSGGIVRVGLPNGTYTNIHKTLLYSAK